MDHYLNAIIFGKKNFIFSDLIAIKYSSGQT
jgi:hypothetical protein